MKEFSVNYREALGGGKKEGMIKIFFLFVSDFFFINTVGCLLIY